MLFRKILTIKKSVFSSGLKRLMYVVRNVAQNLGTFFRNSQISLV
jgi:hypothetical protein